MRAELETVEDLIKEGYSEGFKMHIGLLHFLGECFPEKLREYLFTVNVASKLANSLYKAQNYLAVHVESRANIFFKRGGFTKSSIRPNYSTEGMRNRINRGFFDIVVKPNSLCERLGTFHIIEIKKDIKNINCESIRKDIERLHFCLNHDGSNLQKCFLVYCHKSKSINKNNSCLDELSDFDTFNQKCKSQAEEYLLSITVNEVKLSKDEFSVEVFEIYKEFAVWDESRDEPNDEKSGYVLGVLITLFKK